MLLRFANESGPHVVFPRFKPKPKYKYVSARKIGRKRRKKKSHITSRIAQTKLSFGIGFGQPFPISSLSLKAYSEPPSALAKCLFASFQNTAHFFTNVRFF